MRKIVLFITAIIALSFLAACANETANNEPVSINVMLVDGAPLLSVVNIMADDADGIDGFDFDFTMTNDVDAIVAALLNQEPDFAIVPVNIAAMMNNNGSGYRLAAVTTWGIMHVVSDRDVTTLDELIGETVIAFGRGGTPGITLRAVLDQSGIGFIEHDDANFTPDPARVNIIYLTAASDVRDAIGAGLAIGGEPATFGLLAEPVATAITGFANNMDRPGFMARINIQTEWARNNNGEIYPQAVLIFHERLLDDNEAFVNDFIALVEQSSIIANNNPAETGDLAVELGSISIPNGTLVENAFNAGRLPISFTRADEAQSAVETFLQAIMDENANLIGGRMPDESFYFRGN